MLRLPCCLAALILSACAAAPQKAEEEVAKTYPQIKVTDHQCDGGRLSRLLIAITPGNSPNGAVVTIAPSVCRDDSI